VVGVVSFMVQIFCCEFFFNLLNFQDRVLRFVESDFLNLVIFVFSCL